MEILILICLILVIILLAKDKIVIRKVVQKNADPSYVNPDLPDIMGKPKERRMLSTKVNESQPENGIIYLLLLNQNPTKTH